LRTSPWDPKEQVLLPRQASIYLICLIFVVQLPPDYARIFKLANAQQSAAVAKRKAEAECFE